MISVAANAADNCLLTEDSAVARKRLKHPPWGRLRSSADYCSLTLRVSAIRLSSGSERAFIFRIRWVRCTFTVDQTATPRGAGSKAPPQSRDNSRCYLIRVE